MRRVLLLALALLATTASPAGAETRPVNGTWQELVAAVPLSFNPFTHATTFIGSTAWSGTWTGVTLYKASGTFDLLGDSSGSGDLTETFTGRADTGGVGTLTFAEHIVVLPGGATHIDARITSGTGALAGATGTVTFVGTVNAITGSGTYSGSWDLPSTAAVTP